MKIIFRAINRMLSAFDAKIVRIKRKDKIDFKDIYASDVPENEIVNVLNLSALSRNILGMISTRAGEELFSIVYMQNLSGDVAEIGSFQGKSTYFLGSAVKLSGNGKMFSIDHFKGNVGKEHFYKIGKDDLSDLEDGFRNNIKRAFLEDTVNIINKSSDEAVNYIEDNSLRFLFIDGDHTADGLTRDLDLFRSKMKKKAIIAFDDYSPSGFPDVVEVTNNFIASENIDRKYLLGRTLIVELTEDR